jgi:two-component system, chemotaxis family, protein-glutamate methylesterase/glutaminase
MTDNAPHAPARKIRVLVVDDSALVRKAIGDALARDPELEVVGTAPDPYVAREKIARLDPDVLTLDLEMPRMDGLSFLRILMQYHPLPVVVVSSLAQAGSQAALDAVEAGAIDVLAKPDGTMSIGALADKLAWHVKAAAAAGRHLRRSPRAAATPVPARLAATGAAAPLERQLIVIGASTGGVGALKQLVPALPPGLPPIAIVQHISPTFSRAVAERLAEISSVKVREAGDDEPLLPGECVIAPGDIHLAVEHRGGFRTRLVKSPPLHHCRPAVDVLFRSAADAAGPHAVAALLTGMGSDGALGMQAIRTAGGATLAEHESSCVVYGMPKAAIDLGVVERVVPLPQMAAALIEAAARRT